MAYAEPSHPFTRKRKRRRRQDKPPISASIFLDSTLKGEQGVLSEDLALDLFPWTEPRSGEALHCALTPWTPSQLISVSNWTLLPFRRQVKGEKPLPSSTIRFPATARGTHSFVSLVQAVSPHRTIRQDTAVEVRISDVVPLALETVFVSVDAEALKKLEEVQKRYGGGFANLANGHAPLKREVVAGTTGEEVEEEGTQERLVHEALERIDLVHTGDMLPLPLTHPITHASAPPARVLGCEPVSQGLLTPTTKVVITSAATERRSNHFGNRALMSPSLDEEMEEDTSNEAFYSATEEARDSPRKPIVTSKSTTDLSNTDDSPDESTEESNLSDDSDDMISLAKPSGLTDRPSGLSSVSSSMTSATPRPFGGSTGGIGTPGSVFSNVTASTVRGGNLSRRSKMFKPQGLLERISDELLYPKPPSDEDEEARVYVDASALARLGCFSGDWVKLEAAENTGLPQFSELAGVNGAVVQQNWRPMKIYGLPESMSKRPQRYQIQSRHGRSGSISFMTTAPGTAATLYASPILLANLNQPETVSLSPLSLGKRMAMKGRVTQRSASAPEQPPTAYEVTLRKVVTPLSNERALNSVLFANLKEHFERKQRIVKPGDLIAITVDERLGRTLYEGGAEQGDSMANALLAQWQPGFDGSTKKGGLSAAWFSIESVNVQPQEGEAGEILDLWAGAASIDPTCMTMRQSGDDVRRLPSATSNAWPYYMGTRKAPLNLALAAAGSATTEAAPQPYASPLQRRLRELVSVSTSPRAVALGLPPLALLLTSTQRSIGKAHTLETTCADLGLHYFAIDANDIVSDSGTGFDNSAQGLLEARCERAFDCGPEYTVLCIKHLETLNSDRVAACLKGVLGQARVMVATSTDVDKVPETVRALFTHELVMSAPDEGEREGILRGIVADSGVPLAPDVDLAAIAVKTAALVAGDLVDVVDRAIVARTERLGSLAGTLSETTPVRLKDIQLAGGSAATSLLPSDLEAAVEQARKNFADAIGAPKIPDVQWSDVGGLTHVKDAVIETIQLPLSRPELFAKDLKKRSGILFYGPPGTGKTLLAKAIATEFSLNFFSVKGPELLNMYIGESEANVRRIFQRARDARPCVVFFDELDSIAPKRGNQGDSGGVMDRIVSQLLAELDGMCDGEESGGGVFVIGATNRPDLLDQALLRPGRFDRMLYLGISDTHEKQETILRALTRKFKLNPELSFQRIADTLPFTFTGADLYALCSDAMLKAVTRSARAVDGKLAAINAKRAERGQSKASVAYYFDHFATDEDTEVDVTEEDFMHAKRELVPSISVDELKHYERVRDTFEGTTKNRDTAAESEAPSRPPTASSRGSETRVSRKQLTDTVKRAHSSKNRLSVTNGSRAATAKIAGGASDADEDYVIRTDKLSLNGGAVGRPPSSKYKGKGKATDFAMPDGPGQTNGAAEA